VKDGNIRGWEANVSPLVGPGSSDYYQSTTFGYGNAGLSLNGRGANADSGGPVFDLSGNLVGINDAVSFIGDGSIGATDFLKLSNPTIYNWIVQNTQVPEPTTGALIGLGAGIYLASRRKQED
jgi:hypothetical protein